MPKAKTKTKAIIKNASLDATTGKSLYIYDERFAEEVEKEIHADAKRLGCAFRIGNGPVQWYEDNVVFDHTKRGSEQFIWDKTGNRVKHDRMLVSRDAEGTLTKKKVGTVYKADF